MNVYDGKHWNIYDILPYQRNFNLINGTRSLGKTYTCQMYILNKCLENGWEFIFITRTLTEKKNGAFERAFKKVTAKEFKDIEFKYNNGGMYYNDENDVQILIGYNIALSEVGKLKNNSFPLVKYILFDEYVLEEDRASAYIGGWKEPDKLLSLYHTVDREEDRVIVFMLANNIKFFNPYHIHPAFNVPKIDRGSIWTSENVLFQNCQETKSLLNDKKNCKFLNMIKGTEYGNYAQEGKYILDNEEFIGGLSDTSRYQFTIEYMGKSFGVYNDYPKGVIVVSDKVDPSCKLIYALTLDDHKENTMLTKSGSYALLKWLGKNYKLGNVRFETMKIKTWAEPGVRLLI